MRRLKKRQPIDVLQRESRHRKQAWTRWVYLAAVLGIFVWLADMLVGPYLYFQGDGMVLALRTTVATEYPARIRAVNVREGDAVQAGETIAVVTSQDVTEGIARLTARYAEQRTRLAELRIRAQVIDAVTGVAEDRAKVARQTREDLERLHKRGLLPSSKRSSAFDSEFRSLQDVETLNAERKAIVAEITELSAALNEVEVALNELRGLYDQGRLHAPATGLVGALHVAQGSVVRSGEPIVDLYGGPRFVLAYVPTGTLYRLAAGDRVTIGYGLDEMTGTIERLEPVAAALPREFQRSFKPVERAQLARIALDPGQDTPPLFSKVSLSSAGWPPAWTMRLFGLEGGDAAPPAQAAEAARPGTSR